MRRPKRRGALSRPPFRLLRLNRHSMASILVTGGLRQQRESMARAFHRASPLRKLAFEALDCAADEPMLRRALHCWLLQAVGGHQANPLEHLTGGTLFLDRLEELSEDGQRELLLLLRRIEQEPGPAAGLPGRVAVGCAVAQVGDGAAGIRPELLDCVDKIRVSAGPEALPLSGRHDPGARLRHGAAGGGHDWFHARP